jgi:hypothetical protein
MATEDNSGKSQNSQSAGRDWNSGPSAQETGCLATGCWEVVVIDKLLRRLDNCELWSLCRTVIPKLGYEPRHLGVRENKLNNGGKIPLFGYLFTDTTYKFQITATVLITNILPI